MKFTHKTSVYSYLHFYIFLIYIIQGQINSYLKYHGSTNGKSQVGQVFPDKFLNTVKYEDIPFKPIGFILINQKIIVISQYSMPFRRLRDIIGTKLLISHLG